MENNTNTTLRKKMHDIIQKFLSAGFTLEPIYPEEETNDLNYDDQYAQYEYNNKILIKKLIKKTNELTSIPNTRTFGRYKSLEILQKDLINTLKKIELQTSDPFNDFRLLKNLEYHISGKDSNPIIKEETDKDDDIFENFIKALKCEKFNIIAIKSENKEFPKTAKLSLRNCSSKEYNIPFIDIGIKALLKIIEADNFFKNGNSDSFLSSYEEAKKLEEEFYKKIKVAKSRLPKGHMKKGKQSEKKKKQDKEIKQYMLNKLVKGEQYKAVVAETREKFNISEDKVRHEFTKKSFKLS